VASQRIRCSAVPTIAIVDAMQTLMVGTALH